MSRFRIRSVKPEMRQDERYGRMSRDARELFNGLITMADDEGRVRALPAAILGHVFPYDDDAPRKLKRWMREIEQSGMVVMYEHEGVPYVAFRRWRRHQQINRPSKSLLPPPPDPQVINDNSVKPHDQFSEESLNGHGARTDDVELPTRARGSDRIGSDLSARERAEARGPEAGTDDDAHRLATMLAELIQEHDPKFDTTIAASKTWLRDMRALLTARHGDATEIERVMRWAKRDNFWSGNITTPRKLRDQFTGLLQRADLHAAGATHNGPPPASVDDLVDAYDAWQDTRA